MNPYVLERLAAERQADFRKEARDASLDGEPRGGLLRLVVAAALRGVADRLDGGDPARKRLGAARALD